MIEQAANRMHTGRGPVLLVLLMAGCCLTAPDHDARQRTSASGIEMELATLVNRHRMALNLDTLEWDERLHAVALEHSTDMTERSFFNHINPDGIGPFRRLALSGVSYSWAGENIARGQTSPSAVLRDWLRSPSHRRNIENPCYVVQGIGYDSSGNCWTHIFVTPAMRTDTRVLQSIRR